VQLPPVTHDLYEVLELSPDADQAAITSAWRRLLLAYHPDRNKSPEAAAKTVEINSAYRILSDPAQRARYDAQRAGPTTHAIPRAVLGASKLVLYDLLERKPRHRHVLWSTDGIWAAISERFAECRRRGCLVLLKIDPDTKEQVYQHDDPGPTIRINPEKGEFALLQPWLEQCHQAEDATR
jgi:hypothetical protein